MIRRRRPPRPAAPELAPVIHLWILRMLVPLGGHSQLLGPRGFSNDELATAIGLGAWVDSEDDDYDAAAMRARLRSLHQAAERKPGDAVLPPTLRANVARLAELGAELFEVASEDDDGDPVMGERRLRAFRAAQSFFGQRHAMLLYDEAEDVFNDGDGLFGRKSTAQRRKGWLNRALEHNAVPTLWLSNTIDSIDPAFIRRFDMVIDMPLPPRAQRERIVHQACGDLVDAATVTRIASADALAPATVARAASVMRTIRDQFDADGAARGLDTPGRRHRVAGHAFAGQGQTPRAQHGIGQRLDRIAGHRP